MARRIWKKLRDDIPLLRSAYELIKTDDDVVTKFEGFAWLFKG
jgi:hypothetical protein